MAGEQKGRAFVLKLGDGATPTEAFTTIAALRTTQVTINNEIVDITNKDSAGWRTLLADAGVRSVDVSAGGIFATGLTTGIQPEALNGTISNYELVFEDDSKFAGAFMVESMDYQGDHNDSRQYNITLQSSGSVTFTAAT